MIYGANGYTGRLIVERAVALGMKPLVAGRDVLAIPQLADDLGLEEVFDLDDPNEPTAVLKECTWYLVVPAHSFGSL